MTLFTIGIVGVGLVAIPTLITSSAYALAETFRWKDGLHRRFHAARPFYSVILLSSPGRHRSRFHKRESNESALLVGGRQRTHRSLSPRRDSARGLRPENHAGQPSPLSARLTVGLAALAMFGAAIGMFAF